MPDYSAYQNFLQTRKSDLRKIANRTRREAEVEDVEQEAWIAAELIERRTGSSFDFNSQSQQEYLMGWLNNEFNKFTEKTVRYATSIDQDQNRDEKHEAGSLLRHIELLMSEADPLAEIQTIEEADYHSAAFENSYSEAIAYALLLQRYMGDAPKLAEYLCIAFCTLMKRMNRAIELLGCQPTLFDGIEKIDPDFIARKEKQAVRGRIPAEGIQGKAPIICFLNLGGSGILNP